MKKLHRLMLKAVAGAGGVVAKHETCRGHFHVSVQLPSGRIKKVTASGSPSVPEHSLHHFTTTVKKLIRDDGQPESSS